MLTCITVYSGSQERNHDAGAPIGLLQETCDYHGVYTEYLDWVACFFPLLNIIVS